LERNTHILKELEGKNKEYWVVSNMVILEQTSLNQQNQIKELQKELSKV
jgi:hypothetical protein